MPLCGGLEENQENLRYVYMVLRPIFLLGYEAGLLNTTSGLSVVNGINLHHTI
jgi:hypothetical protein